MWKTTSLDILILAIHVDDILLTGSDESEISATIDYLYQHFMMGDLGNTRATF